jgi:hypothetical protein
LYNNEHTHTHTHFFSEYRLLWISLYALLILSLYVCIYTYKASHHTHTDTHTFSVYVCLSFVCVCDRERGGVPSLEREMCCTLCGWVVENGWGEFECILSWNSWHRSVEPTILILWRGFLLLWRGWMNQRCLIPNLHQTHAVECLDSCWGYLRLYIVNMNQHSEPLEKHCL